MAPYEVRFLAIELALPVMVMIRWLRGFKRFGVRVMGIEQ